MFFPDSVVVGDVNGDHKLDIVTVSGLAKTVAVLLAGVYWERPEQERKTLF
ncbi:MAG TPA: FG-GAP repeat protein [Candidatus Limnocylindrales bacterium]|nr:FG-GAP repeat protein [Candidatus Limnocylindrales bacterium]